MSIVESILQQLKQLNQRKTHNNTKQKLMINIDYQEL